MAGLSEIRENNIKRYADLLEMIYQKQLEVSALRDKLNNLSACMDQDAINEANMLLRLNHKNDGIWCD